MIKNQEITIEELTLPQKKVDSAPIPFLQLTEDIDIKNRKIYVTNIDVYTPAFIQQRADVIYQMSGDDTTPLTLSISSFGGDAYAMFGIVDVMKLLPSKVNTLGVGTAQSAAATLLVAGTGQRTITENTFVMIHQISTWLGGQADDIAVEAKHTKELQTKLYKLLASKSKKPADFWKKQTKSNLYLPAEKCLEYGLVDVVI